MDSRQTLRILRDEFALPRAAVYRLEGTFGEGGDCGPVLRDMRDRLRSGPIWVILSLERSGYLTSVGVGFLAACFTTARNAGRALVLSDLPRQARRVLDLTGIGEVIPMYATIDDALAAAGLLPGAAPARPSDSGGFPLPALAG